MTSSKVYPSLAVWLVSRASDSSHTSSTRITIWLQRMITCTCPQVWIWAWEQTVSIRCTLYAVIDKAKLRSKVTGRQPHWLYSRSSRQKSAMLWLKMQACLKSLRCETTLRTLYRLPLLTLTRWNSRPMTGACSNDTGKTKTRSHSLESMRCKRRCRVITSMIWRCSWCQTSSVKDTSDLLSRVRGLIAWLIGCLSAGVKSPSSRTWSMIYSHCASPAVNGN